MVTLLAFLLGLAIFYAGYRFGKYANEGTALAFEGQTIFLRDEINFLRADNDHLRSVLDLRVARAHVPENETLDLRDGPPYTATIGLCFHGVSLTEHCGECASGAVFGVSH
jgi:hypothetical protein